MAAMRAELPTKPLLLVAAPAAPPCEVGFAPVRVDVLTKSPYLGKNVPEPNEETHALSFQKGERPEAHPGQN
jgi:hypothetical protein